MNGKLKTTVTPGINKKVVLFLSLFFLLLSVTHGAGQQSSPWIRIDEGLHYSDFKVPPRFKADDARVLVVRIDPKVYDFRLLAASELSSGNVALNAREWAAKYNLIAATNAGMFQADLKSSVGYMKNYSHINNPRRHRTYSSVFAFNPRKADLPPSILLDTDTKDMKQIIAEYHTVIQNLRLIKRPRLNVWPQQDKRWSEAALGQDQDGAVLFIVSGSAFTMHEFGNILLALPIKLECAQHLEGGPLASLYLRHKGTEIRRAGSYELTSAAANRGSKDDGFLPIPNVIGITKKKRPGPG